MLHTVSGLLHPKSGSIVFGGRDLIKNHVPGHELVRAGMAHVPEGRRVFAEMTVYQNLKMGAYTRSDKGGNRADHPDDLRTLSEVGREKKSESGNPLGRRTADACHGKGTDVKAEVDPDG